jgi:hypothetical protein
MNMQNNKVLGMPTVGNEINSAENGKGFESHRVTLQSGNLYLSLLHCSHAHTSSS